MRRWGVIVLLTATAASGLIFSWSDPDPQLPWRRNLPQAREEAREQDLPLLVYLYTDWCPYCEQMERETFADASVIEQMADRFLWIKLNAEKDPEGIRLRKANGLTSYPSIFILNSRGEEVDQLQGFLKPERLRTQVDFLLHGPTSFLALKHKIERNPQDLEAHFGLGEKYLMRGDYREASQHFAEVVRLDPKNQAEQSDAALYYLAVAQASAGLERRALSTTARLEELFPSSGFLPDGMILAGRIHYYDGRRLEAREVFSRYLDRFNEHRSHRWITQLLSEIEQEIRLAEISPEDDPASPSWSEGSGPTCWTLPPPEATAR